MFFDDAKKEAKVSKIPNDVNIKKVSEPNIDTLTYSKAVKTNNKLSTVLKAKQALEFGKYFTFLNAALKPSDVKKNDKFDNLLLTNKKILAVLKKIEENMMDEQNTSIKHNSNDSKNQTVTENGIASNAHDERYNFIVSTGKNGMWVADKLEERGVDLKKMPHIKIRPYIDDMARCLSAADLVICRAGASSLSEIQALGKPSVLIPSPNVTENHQYHNAMALVNKHAAVIIEEKDLNGSILSRNVDNLLGDKRKLKEVGENARAMAVIDATSRICDIVEGLIKK